ncbi:unnamed protein product [Paramecium sonneborni]|uniref:Glycoside hydrolase family 38 N-terminal domain-containing protein n=1 Tax=Paramecium sonneborni TaxID=65129 RepID=A0A8S1P4J3_9CILI|nr:unnamed protein product [Paramecium sonneborni]
MLLLFIFLIEIKFCELVQKCDVSEVCETMQHPIDAKLHFTIHSHLEPFQSFTFHQYQEGIYSEKYSKTICVDCLYEQVIETLVKYPDFTYVIGEICYFREFYEKQNETQQNIIKNFIQQGRIEIVNGGWVQNDQSSSNYQDIILQLQVGHQWVHQKFDQIIQTAWNIDSFGHSYTQSALNYLFNMKQQIIERVDVNDIIQRVKKGKLEFIQHIQPYDYQILTHLRFKRHSQVHINQSKLSDNSQCIQLYNQLKEFEQLIYYQKQGGLGNILFHYSGDTFQLINETNIESQNLIMEFYELFQCRKLQILWSTPNQFFDDLKSSQSFTQISHKYSDFLPHFEDGVYYNAMYITHPLFKKFLRVVSYQLQAINLYTIQHKLFSISYQKLTELIALSQHHHGISATARYQVIDDLQEQIENSFEELKQKINNFSHSKFELIGQLKHTYKQTKRIILDCSQNSKCVLEYFIKNRRLKSVIVLIYNPQHSQTKIIELEIPSRNAQILTQDLILIPDQQVKVNNESNILTFQTYFYGYSEQQFVLNFDCSIDCAFVNEFQLHLDLSEQIKLLEKQFSLGEPIETISWTEIIQNVTLEIQRQGIDYEFIFTHLNHSFSIKYNYYPNTKSQTDKHSAKTPGKSVLMSDFNNGGLICEFEKMYTLKSTSIFQEIILQCGKIYTLSLLFTEDGIELRTQMYANTLTMGDYTMMITFQNITQDSHFYTDSNGLYPIQRESFKREDYEPICSENDQINCNVYPITAYALLQSNNYIAAILTDRSQGVFNLNPQTIEIIVEHLAGDDGLGEACAKRNNHQFRHFIQFNPQCLRCKWNEFLFTSDFIRLSNEFSSFPYKQIIHSRQLRLQFQRTNFDQILLYAENLLEVFDNTSLTNNMISINSTLIEDILSIQNITLQETYLNGIPSNQKQSTLELLPLEIRTYIVNQ